MIGKIIIHLMTSKIKARKVNCPSCTKSMYNYNLQRHLKTCIKNKFCPICQKDISEGSINEHVEECGKHTTLAMYVVRDSIQLLNVRHMK